MPRDQDKACHSGVTCCGLANAAMSACLYTLFVFSLIQLKQKRTRTETCGLLWRIPPSNQSSGSDAAARCTFGCPSGRVVCVTRVPRLSEECPWNLHARSTVLLLHSQEPSVEPIYIYIYITINYGERLMAKGSSFIFSLLGCINAGNSLPKALSCFFRSHLGGSRKAPSKDQCETSMIPV